MFDMHQQQQDMFMQQQQQQPFMSQHPSPVPPNTLLPPANATFNPMNTATVDVK